MHQQVYDFNYDLMEMYKDPQMKPLLGKPICPRPRRTSKANPFVSAIGKILDEETEPIEQEAHTKVRKQPYKHGGFNTPICRVMDYLQLSCSDLGRLLKCHPSSISRIRAGLGRPSVKRADDIVATLNAELGETMQVTVEILWPGEKLMEKPHGR